MRKPLSLLVRTLLALATVGAATVVSALLAPHLAPTNLVMVFLLAVVGAATSLGRGPSALVAVLSVAAFDFFFVPPHLTFAVDDVQYLFTFFVMLIVGLTISTLTSRLSEEAYEARERERRAEALFRLGRLLAEADFEGALLHAAVRETREMFGAESVVLLTGERGELEPRAATPEAPELGEEDLSAATWAFGAARPSGVGTETHSFARGLYVPLPGPLGGVLGVLGLRWEDRARRLSDNELQLLETFANQIALALGRVRRPVVAEQR